jgi:hypothetical protein
MSAPEQTFDAIKRGMDEWVADRTNTELGESVIRYMRNFIKMRESGS